MTWQVLKNGVLVDPNNHEAISEALLKLLADKQYWTECQQNGLKNIHRFSWPEHCKAYLSQIGLCRLRSPKWKTDESPDYDSDSQEDLLRNVGDLKVSLDGDKGSLDDSMEIGDLLATEENKQEERNSLDFSSESLRLTPFQKVLQNKNSLQTWQIPQTPNIRNRKRIINIAVDCDDANDLVCVVNNIFKATNYKEGHCNDGYILSSSLRLQEMLSILGARGISLCLFDVLICSSGSELYYPAATHGDGDGVVTESQFIVDSDYEANISYRWHRESLCRTLEKWMKSMNIQLGLNEDKEVFNNHCLAYSVRDVNMCMKVDGLRKRLRQQGLRCNVIYCQNSSRLHIIPLHASRSQSLRYLCVRWGFDLSSTIVFVGERGDTDYEELFSGTHRTLILRGSVKQGSQNLLRISGSYQREDVIPSDSSRIVCTKSTYTPDEIKQALDKL
ncbi:hypothetical protein KP509_04G026900 [Ceratopteris richardii]|uniref:Sucrose phosphatase-like domain-containing protein n=1 Tax=Ceratopteris richardii TaxID=49495 RepID=A0A8T2URB1_CERRI|nr:hypothetical protein KP509_04G026900 [Ceratopteris richardii]